MNAFVSKAQEILGPAHLVKVKRLYNIPPPLHDIHANAAMMDAVGVDLVSEAYRQSILSAVEGIYQYARRMNELPEHWPVENYGACRIVSDGLRNVLNRKGHSLKVIGYEDSENYHFFDVERVKGADGKEILWVIDLTWQQFLSNDRKTLATIRKFPKAMIIKSDQLENFFKEYGVDESKWKYWKMALEQFNAGMKGEAEQTNVEWGDECGRDGRGQSFGRTFSWVLSGYKSVEGASIFSRYC